MTVHVAIGNTDNRLTQQAWSRFALRVDSAVRANADSVHGEWYSPSAAPYQNACWAFEAAEPSRSILRRQLADLAREYDQDAVAWNESDTELL